jgi:hypothetical protein
MHEYHSVQVNFPLRSNSCFKDQNPKATEYHRLCKFSYIFDSKRQGTLHPSGRQSEINILVCLHFQEVIKCYRSQNQYSRSSISGSIRGTAFSGRKLISGRICVPFESFNPQNVKSSAGLSCKRSFTHVFVPFLLLKLDCSIIIVYHRICK